jgi:hypothetical protein
MPRQAHDEDREQRITYHVVVDAYGSEEQAMGWYYYLQDGVTWPLRARCVSARAVSPLRVGEEVTVTGMAPEDDCMKEMVVLVRQAGRTFGVPLAQLEPVDVDAPTEQALADWQYWVERGYQF